MPLTRCVARLPMHRRRRDAAAERPDRPARRYAGPPNRSVAAGAERRRRACIGTATPFTLSSNARAGHRGTHRPIDVELRADERHFEGRRAGVVADERIGQPMRVGVHRAGHRHAGGLMAPAPEVLHRGQQPGTHHRDGVGAHDAGPAREQRPLPRAAPARSARDRRRRAPRGRARVASNIRHGVRPTSRQPPGLSDGYTPGLPAGDADAAGRHRARAALRAAASRSGRRPPRDRRSRAGSPACRRGRSRRCAGARPRRRLQPANAATSSRSGPCVAAVAHRDLDQPAGRHSAPAPASHARATACSSAAASRRSGSTWTPTDAYDGTTSRTPGDAVRRERPRHRDRARVDRRRPCAARARPAAASRPTRAAGGRAHASWPARQSASSSLRVDAVEAAVGHHDDVVAAARLARDDGDDLVDRRRRCAAATPARRQVGDELRRRQPLALGQRAPEHRRDHAPRRRRRTPRRRPPGTRGGTTRPSAARRSPTARAPGRGRAHRRQRLGDGGRMVREVVVDGHAARARRRTSSRRLTPAKRGQPAGDRVERRGRRRGRRRWPPGRCARCARRASARSNSPAAPSGPRERRTSSCRRVGAEVAARQSAPSPSPNVWTRAVRLRRPAPRRPGCRRRAAPGRGAAPAAPAARRPAATASRSG